MNKAGKECSCEAKPVVLRSNLHKPDSKVSRWPYCYRNYSCPECHEVWSTAEIAIEDRKEVHKLFTSKTMMVKIEDLVSVSNAGKIVGVDRQSIYNMIKADKVDYVILDGGGRYVINNQKLRDLKK